MKYIRPIIIGLIPLVIGTLFGFFLESKRAETENQIRYFVYYADVRTDIIQRPFSPIENLEIFYNGDKIDNLNQLSVAIFNPTDRDFTDLVFYIDLIPPKDKSINIVSENISGINQLRDTITPIKNLQQPDDPNIVRYGY